MTSTIGLDILQVLLWFVCTTILGLALQMFVVYSLMLAFVARTSPKQFFVSAREAIFTAFGTSSSNATLPTALRVAKENLRLRPEISQFVLTVGSTANQNGTALFEGVVVLFLAQVFGVQLIDQQKSDVDRSFCEVPSIALSAITASISTRAISLVKLRST